MRALLATLFCVFFLVTPARADDPSDRYGHGHWYQSQPFAQNVSHPARIKHARYAKRSKSYAKNVRRIKSHARRGVSLAGVVAPLAVKVQAVVAKCGSVVVSAVSHRPNRSNHPIGRAVDLQGNPECIKREFAGWPGGMSTDYHTAPGGPHYHVSYNPGGQEWGIRFAHRGKAHRHAKRHRASYAAR